MTINNQIEALSIKNTMVKPVNMTEFNNPFLLLSSTKALNELVANTNPSSRAKVANIEPTKSKFQQNPLGVPIDVYTKDTATTPQVLKSVPKVPKPKPKVPKSAPQVPKSDSLEAHINKKNRERLQKKLKSEWATRVAEQKKRREARGNKPKASAGGGTVPAKRKKKSDDEINKFKNRPDANKKKATVKTESNKEANERSSMKANDINIRRPGRPDQGITRQKKEAASSKAAAKKLTEKRSRLAALNNANKLKKVKESAAAKAAAKKNPGTMVKYFGPGSGNL